MFEVRGSNVRVPEFAHRTSNLEPRTSISRLTQRTALMTATLGRLLILASLLVSSIGAILAFAAGAKKSLDGLKWARRFAFAFAGCMALATLVMEYALLTHDFSVSYVAQVGSRERADLVTIVSLWSSLEGSILFWGFILGIFIAGSRGSPATSAWTTCPYAIGTWLIVGSSSAS